MERRTTQLWILVVAAILAALTLYQAVGAEGAIALAVAVPALVFIYRRYRARRPAGGSGVLCLQCGENLPGTARACPQCGSTRWTYIN